MLVHACPVNANCQLTSFISFLNLFLSAVSLIIEARVIWKRMCASCNINVDVDVVELRAQADVCMPASNNYVNYTIYSNF